MTRGRVFAIIGGVVLFALAGCGRGFFMDGERAAWRHDAEVACLKSGTVKIGVERIDPIEGPGMCGADFPFKVTALGEAPLLSYADDLRPPAAIPNASSDMPRWPVGEPRYAPPRTVPVEVTPARGGHMRWMTGPPGVDRSQGNAQPGQPMSISPPQPQPATNQPMRAAPLPAPTTVPSARARPDDIPADAMIPPGGSAAVPAPRSQDAYNAPAYQPPRLGPTRTPYNLAAVPAANLMPAATLACPLVSALDRWVSEGVQPAALRWFNSPVTEIKQIGSYSCRGMVGGSGVSEHSYGNALDIAGFTLANGRAITVKKGWDGTPEEQGFLHDVQLYACQTFVTVLAPGYNVYHYDHIHVDLMRREAGYRPCRPDAIPGEVAAAKARAVYASHRRGPAYTGSIGDKSADLSAVPGADGYVPDSDVKETAAPVSVPPYLGHARMAPAEDRLTMH
jgi:Extensin-like protein C-terminus